MFYERMTCVNCCTGVSVTLFWGTVAKLVPNLCSSGVFLQNCARSWCQERKPEVDVYIYILLYNYIYRYVWRMWVDAGWRGGVAQCELAKKLAQDWSRRKKLTTAAFYADHVGAWFLVFFLNRKDRTLPALACATANQSATTGDADHNKHGEPTQINETTRNPRWTTPKPKKQNAKRENTPLSLALNRPERLGILSNMLPYYIYILCCGPFWIQAVRQRGGTAKDMSSKTQRSQKKTTTEETYNPRPWNP